MAVWLGHTGVMGRLYHEDFYGWSQDQADALRRRSANEIDWDNLLEEIEGLGATARNELRNRLAVLFAHLLKWRFQPTRRTRSWVLTIREQRQQIRRLMKESPSLKAVLDEVSEQAYASALNMATDQTGLPDKAFPQAAPFSFEEGMVEFVEWTQA